MSQPSPPRQISLSAFFPAFNEAENVEATVREAVGVFTRLVTQFEVIVVNDGSADATGEIADRLAKEDQRIRVIHHDRNRGYGAALRTGITAARFDFVFFSDIDRQFVLEEIASFLPALDDCDVIIGFRKDRRDPLPRRLNAAGWNLANRLLLGLRVKDVNCAFKLFKRDQVQSTTIISEGAMVSAELLTRLKRRGARFKELPVTHLPRLKGAPTGAKPSVIAKAFLELIRVHRSLRRDGNH
jgi:glycosyltransferase involved in cell wall biosynthesis